MEHAQHLPVPLTYTRIMLRVFGTEPETRRRLLAGTDITPARLEDPAAESSLRDLLMVFDNAHRLLQPGWTLELARHFDLAAQGALGFAMACAPTLGASFDIMARYGHVRAPWFRLRVFHDGNTWGVRLVRQFPVAPHLDVAMVEAILLAGQTLVESVLGQRVTQARHDFDFARPRWHAGYREHFHGRVTFDAPQAGFSMPAAWRSMPCHLADAGMYQAALGRLELERRRLDSGDFLTTRVSLLLDAGGDAGLDLQTVAERMNVSRRTLIRRLREAGTSYRELLGSHRMDRASALLRGSRHSVAEIAYRLGYSEPANFTRAFRRRFDATPSAWRAAAR